VLVTGAGGFIGSHLAESLVRLGAKTRALVHYNALGSRGWLDHSALAGQMEIVAGDVTDRESVAQAMRGVDTVFHLAALIGIPYSYQAPVSYMRTNIEGTINILQAGRESGVRRVVHTSTSEVYGTARYVPIDEQHPLQGQSPYSATKIGADKLAESFYAAFAVPVVTVRPFNTFGPRQSLRAVVPTIITQCLAGQVISLGSTKPTRDLTFVADTVSGFIHAGAADGVCGRVFNLGTGREISVGDLVALIGRLAGCPVRIEQDPKRMRPENSEVERLLSNNSAARASLGWQPEVTLEAGLERTIEWFRERQSTHKPSGYAV
jgi:dTDP-glucose 4,6-dehydratase